MALVADTALNHHSLTHPNLTVNLTATFAYGGRASDKHITLDSNSLLGNLPPGSEVMADRGFRVEKQLYDLGCKTDYSRFQRPG